MFIIDSQTATLDPTRFVYSPRMDASPEQWYTTNEILDADQGRVYSFITYPEGSIYPTLLEVGGADHLVSVFGSAAEALWSELNKPEIKRFVRLPNLHGYPDYQQMFDLHEGILYKYRQGGALVIESPSGKTRVKFREIAEVFWKYMWNLAGPDPKK